MSSDATPAERADHSALMANAQARLHELEVIRTWERDPQLYAETLATSLASQAIFTYAPAAERARRLLSKLRQVTGVLDAARGNVREPAGIFIKTAAETLRGVVSFLDRDLPRALREVDDLSLLADLDDASTVARTAIEGYVRDLEEEQAPRAKATFRIGRNKIEQKLKLEDGVTLDTDALLRIAERELAATRERFNAVASKVGKGPAEEVWAKVKAGHVAPGGLVTRVREQCAALYTFLRDAGIVTVPDADALVIAPTPPFYRWTFASLWAPGPLEARAQRSYYYITDADPNWAQERQDEHLRDMNDAVLWSISMHEALPGHFLHFEHLRKVASPWRKAMRHRAGVGARGLGALRRAHGGRAGVCQEGPGHRARPTGRVAGSALPARGRAAPARRGPVGRAGRPLLPRGSDARRSHGAARGRARRVRSVAMSSMPWAS